MRNLNYKKGFGPLAIILILAIVVAIGGGVYYSNHHPKAYVEEDMTASSSAEANVSGNMSSGTIRSLLALGGNSMCTINESNASSSLSGTIYISGNMMRGDFTSNAKASNSVESHIIRNGDTMFAWSGSQGAKMMFNGSATTSAESKSNVNIDQKIEYKCSSWNPDSSKFSAPSSVHFVDLSAMMKLK